MKRNKNMNFYNKPKKAGIYLLNRGDVVTDANMEAVNVYKNEDDKWECYTLSDPSQEKTVIEEMSGTSWKWFPATEIFKDLDNSKCKIKKNKNISRP